MRGNFPEEADLLLAQPPQPPFDWVREGASFWMFEENGDFGMPRTGVEAEPQSWLNRRYQANFCFRDGRVLRAAGLGEAHPVLDHAGQPRVIGAGPLRYRCVEPFRRWVVSFDGMVVDTHVDQQIALSVDTSKQVPLKYEFELAMVSPPNEQDVSPDRFFTWGKGKQRDAVSVGLGWRFEQMMRGEGEVTVDGTTRTARVVGSRVKRRSIRTDGLFLRGHVWQAVVFPDGRAVGYEARPAHDDGHEPWNEAFVYQDGRMHYGRATRIPFLDKVIARGDDVSFEVETELGTTRVEGTTELSTFQLSKGHLWGLALGQSGARYTLDGQTALGMVERSSVQLSAQQSPAGAAAHD